MLPGPKLDGASLYELMESERVTVSAGVPTIWLALLQYVEANKLRFTTMRRTAVGGSAMPLALIAKFADEYGVEVRHGWGMTETTAVATMSALMSKHDPLSAADKHAVVAKQGKSVFGVEIKVVDESGATLPRDGSSQGELMVRGQWIVSGYFKGESSPLQDGWFPTGDVATIDAEPFPLDFDPATTALLIIDMQRDFVLPGGFGEKLGNDTSLLLAAVGPIGRVLARAREIGMFVIHTREGHRPDLSDCPPAKLTRGGKTFIGEDGPMGRILVRGEKGHDIIEDLYPIDGEPVIDKPGKGSFYATDLEDILQNRGIKTLVVCGVTTEVCVHTTVREANDRGYRCVVVEDGVASYFPEFQRVALEMIKAQGAIFGWVSDSEKFIAATA